MSREFQDTQTGEVSCVHPRMILGWSKYPGNPRIPIWGGGGAELCPTQTGVGGWTVHPRMILVDVSRESQDIQTEGGELCPSWHDTGMVGVSWESQDTPIWRVVISVHITMILGWSEYPGSPWILKQGGDSPPQDDPGLVKVFWESQDTQTGEVSCVHPRMILGWSMYPWNPRILKQGWVGGLFIPGHPYMGEGVSSVHPRMIKGWSKYLRNPRILRHREVSFVHPEMVLGWLEYPGNPRIPRKGGGWTVSIPG